MACAILLCACTTHPITGREQIVAMHQVQVAHADAGFAISSGARRLAAFAGCAEECVGAVLRKGEAERIEAIGSRLEIAARAYAPELFERIGSFSIEIDEDPAMRTGSSAGGRIVLGAGLVREQSPGTDFGVGWLEAASGLAGRSSADVRIAFLVAREMGHVIARHAEEDSGAAIVFSALGLLIPGVNVVARFVASRVGAGAVREAWAVEQAREADEIALALLSRAGVSALAVSMAIRDGREQAGESVDAWDAQYLESIRRVAQAASEPLRYSGPGG